MPAAKRSPATAKPLFDRQGTMAHCADRSSLMNVGRRVDYAIRALAYLAGQSPKRIVPCGEIEARQGVPRHFLSKILRSLVAAGLLESLPGARGGFRLQRPAAEISVRQVYEGVEGKLRLIDCLYDGDGFCCFAPVCTQIDVWRGAQQRLLEYLDSVSIHDIADRQGLITRLPKTG
jgi:Rrf2 family protein